MKKTPLAIFGLSLLVVPLTVALANWDDLPFQRPPHPNLDIKSSRDSLTVDVSEYSAVFVVANNSGHTIKHLQFNTSTFKNNLGVYHGLGELKDGEQRIVVAYNRSPGLVRMTWIGEKVVLGYRTNVVTVINVFTVEPENQQQLVDMLVEATEKTIKNASGFVSVNIHKSLDGVRVVNYAQWRSREDIEAMAKNPEAQAHMKPIMEIAKADFHVYQVADSLEIT